MDRSKALETLKHYNNWRRDRNEFNQYEMPDPKDIGEAIDHVIALLEIESLTDQKYLSLVDSSKMWTASLPVLMYLINKHFGIDTGLKEQWNIAHHIRGEV